MTVLVSVHVLTYGCSMNQADTEIILGLLEKEGYSIAESDEQAEIIIINTCGVKEPTEKKILREISRLSQLGKPFIICGCLPRINFEEVVRAGPNFAAILDTNSLFNIVDIVKRVKRGERGIINLEEKKGVKLGNPRKLVNPVIAIIPIGEGCLGDCYYCCVKFARGKLLSYSPESILKEVETSLKMGCKEVWLTSQDTGAYRWNGDRLPELLQKIVRLPFDFKVRIGMMNPKQTIPILDKLVDVYQNQKIYKFLHIPVQSGSNEILEAMNRGYTREQFTKIVETFKEGIPNITLSTDIIVGFPGETDEYFKESVNLIQEIKPDIVNISRFAPRPKTQAEKMENQIPGWIIKERSRKLAKITQRIGEEKNKKWIGWKGKALISEKGAKEGWIARNYAYKPILVQDPNLYLGEKIGVEITEAKQGYLIGKKIKNT
ncbi:MAG: tRNA (N(6)-L-threonylcarbamoyladenosine(37)-C(2))-methylthiotransferase [Candidatus Jordarchaeaceae archaeon]